MIRSRILLNHLSGQYLEVDLDVDLAHLPDEEWEFVLGVFTQLRAFEKCRYRGPGDDSRIGEQQR